MSKLYLAAIWILVAIPIATPISFNELNDSFISNVSQLPPPIPIPDNTPIDKEHLSGYIDIVGYTRMAKINNHFYSDGTPIAIGDSWISSLSGLSDSLKNDITISNTPTTTIATLTSTLNWHTRYCDKRGCFVNGRFQDTETYQATYQTPLSPPNSSSYATIYEYPNKTILSPHTDNIITSFTITSHNRTLTRHLQIAHISYDKGIPYANFTSFPMWSGDIPHIGDDIILPDSNFTFTVSTPFTTQTVQNISTIKMHPTSMSPFNLLIFTILFLGYFTIKVIT